VCNPQEIFFRPIGLLDLVVSIVFLVILTELIVESVYPVTLVAPTLIILFFRNVEIEINNNNKN
jgi:hypothetical protein